MRSLLKMTMTLGVLLQVIPAFAQSWLAEAKRNGLTHISVCGSNAIQNTKRSVQRDLIVSGVGYFFSELPSWETYDRILSESNSPEAKEQLKAEFAKTILWQVSGDGKLVSLGHPTLFMPKFTSTVKECIAGAQKTIGGHCRDRKPEDKKACCKEKFIGPVIEWKTPKVQAELWYSPDPSVRLKVKGERAHRFCHVVDRYKLK